MPKVIIHGDRNDEFIRAYMNLSKENKEVLDQVIRVVLFDGYSLTMWGED